MHQFLRGHTRQDKNSPYTHTSLCDPKRACDIPEDEMKEFYKLYVEYDGEKGITEKKTPNYGVMIGDFDFQSKSKTRIITKNVIKQIVSLMTCITKDFFEKKDDSDSSDSDNSSDIGSDEDDNDKDKYMCVAFQRPEPYKKKVKVTIDDKTTEHEVWCDGLHLHFPHIICDYDIQHAIRNRFLEECTLGNDKNKKLSLKLDCFNKLDKIYDKAVVATAPWLLLGSTKPGLKPYEIVSVYNSKINLDDYSEIKRVKFLSIRENVNNETRLKLANPNMLTKYRHSMETKQIYTKINTRTIILVDGNKKKNTIKRDRQYNIFFIKKMLNLLKKTRADDYEFWINIGLILHYCSMTDTNKDNDYLELWKTWSKQSDKYKEGECEYYWKKFKTTNDSYLTLGTLIYYAKIDDLEKYTTIKIQDYITTKCKDLLPDKKVKIGNVTKTVQGVFVDIAPNNDEQCIISDKKHDDSSGFAHINSNGLVLKCKHEDCLYKQLPDKELSYAISIDMLETIFGVKNVYTTNVTDDTIPRKMIDDGEKMKAHYKIFENKILNELCYRSLSGAGHDIAKLTYYVYHDKFRCTTHKEKTCEWYEFTGNRWESCGPQLFDNISSDLPKLLSKMEDYYNKLKPSNDDEKKYIISVIKSIQRTTNILKTTALKTSHMTDIRSIFYLADKKFVDKLDSNPDLLGFNDGVYDLIKHEFRRGKPEDYVSMTVGYDFPTTQSIHYNTAMRFLKDIQPNKDQREFMLKFLSTGLWGRNPNEIALILSGSIGGNGKTKLKDLLECTLGDYFGTFASNFLTEKRPPPGSQTIEIKEIMKTRINSSFLNILNIILFTKIHGRCKE
jgi:hypothetical protein